MDGRRTTRHRKTRASEQRNDVTKNIKMFYFNGVNVAKHICATHVTCWMLLTHSGLFLFLGGDLSLGRSGDVSSFS